MVQIYLSIHRPDLARKEAERAKGFADDDLLLQLIEASIDLVAVCLSIRFSKQWVDGTLPGQIVLRQRTFVLYGTIA